MVIERGPKVKHLSSFQAGGCGLKASSSWCGVRIRSGISDSDMIKLELSCGGVVGFHAQVLRSPSSCAQLNERNLNDTCTVQLIVPSQPCNFSETVIGLVGSWLFNAVEPFSLSKTVWES